MCDDLRPDGHYRGWADRVALGLARQKAPAPVEYANLAVRGKLIDQVLSEQVAAGIALDPTIVTFHAGANDVLRRGTDLDDLVRRYGAAVDELGKGGARVVLFTSIGRAGGTGRLAQLIADRFAHFNDGVRRAARDTGATLVDLGQVPALTDRRLWHVDRLHLTPEGHARVAAAVLEALGTEDAALLGGPAGWWRVPLPDAAAAGLHRRLVEDAAWINGHLLPWVGRRLRGVSSGDGREPKNPTLTRVEA
jgi:lysophospholipase L1-like esterase